MLPSDTRLGVWGEGEETHVRIEWTAPETLLNPDVEVSTHNVTRPAHELRFLRAQQRTGPLRITHHPLRPRRCVCLTGFRTKDWIGDRHHSRRSQTRSECFGYLLPTQLTRSAPCQTIAKYWDCRTHVMHQGCRRMPAMLILDVGSIVNIASSIAVQECQ